MGAIGGTTEVAGKTVYGGAGKKPELSKAARGFEALFLNTMLRTMRATVPGDGLLGKGPGEDVFTSLFDMEIARKVAGETGLDRFIIRGLRGRGDVPEGKLKDGPEGFSVK